MNRAYAYLKDEYLETKANGNGNGNGYSFRQLQLLRDMAEHDVYPDGRFSDEECNVWEMFRRTVSN